MPKKENEDEYSILKCNNQDETDLDWNSYTNKNTNILDKNKTNVISDKKWKNKQLNLENSKNISFKRFKEAAQHDEIFDIDVDFTKNKKLLNISSLTNMIENDKTNIFQKKKAPSFYFENLLISNLDEKNIFDNHISDNKTSFIQDNKISNLLCSSNKSSISNIDGTCKDINLMDKNQSINFSNSIKTIYDENQKKNILTVDKENTNINNLNDEKINLNNKFFFNSENNKSLLNNMTIDKINKNESDELLNNKHTLDKDILINDVKKENANDNIIEKNSYSKIVEDMQKFSCVNINSDELNNLKTVNNSKVMLIKQTKDYNDQTLNNVKIKLNEEINKIKHQSINNNNEISEQDKNYELLVQQYNTKLKNEKEYKRQLDNLNKIIKLRDLEISCLKEREIPENNVIKYVYEGKKILNDLSKYYEEKEENMNKELKAECLKNKKLTKEINCLKEVIEKLLVKIKCLNK